jgi:hypothetical protein
MQVIFPLELAEKVGASNVARCDTLWEKYVRVVAKILHSPYRDCPDFLNFADWIYPEICVSTRL